MAKRKEDSFPNKRIPFLTKRTKKKEKQKARFHLFQAKPRARRKRKPTFWIRTSS